VSSFDSKLFEFAKEKTTVLAVEFLLNGKLMATLSKDRKIRLLDFLNGKITQTIDESLKFYSNIQQSTPQLTNMEFRRRIAIEKDIKRNEPNQYSNLLFDESGLFLIYGSLLGVKSKYS
jgi:peptidylprolyl isomerase domain and WD repeat-containing protein 1